MAVLTFYKDTEELMKYVLRKDVTSVGRSSAADVCLPDSNISRTHFTVSFINGKFLVVDKSTNGTIINGEKIISQELQEGDKITIGDWEVVFSSKPGLDTRKITIVEDRDPTEVLSFLPDKDELRYRRAYLQIVGAKPPPYAIKSEVVAVGKAESNDICLKRDSFVSSHHCKIEHRRDRYFIKDLKSTNGTFLNKQQVIEASIPEDSVLTVGKTDIRFFCKEGSEKVKPATEDHFCDFLGNNIKMRKLYSLIGKVAKSEAIVLIQGESGTGKELVAKAIHELSSRASKKLITLNCSAIAKDLIESELFGHEKGAFTSAHQQRKGAFEEADGGTLFLDEIGDMPLELQPKLLRVLENREIKRVGSNALIDVDVRVIAATNRNLAESVKRGRFREDLYHRLYVVPIYVPPLRERVDDIKLLSQHFLDEARGNQRVPQGFTAEAMEALMTYAWPGNVRELKNLVSRACIQATGDLIGEKELNFSPNVLREQTVLEEKGDRNGVEAKKTLKDFEREKILNELNRNKWNKKRTAEVLGIAKTTLFEKIKKYQLKP